MASRQEMNVTVDYGDIPPESLVSRVNSFVRETNEWIAQQPGGFSMELRWQRREEEEEDDDIDNGGSSIEVRRDYNTGSAPILRGYNHCCYCLCSPCVIEYPPNFLRGSCDPHPANCEKRYTLYRKFWSCLNRLGLWSDDEYLQRKEQRTARDDRRDVMPICVVTEIRRRYPSHNGVYRDYVSTFDASMEIGYEDDNIDIDN